MLLANNSRCFHYTKYNIRRKLFQYDGKKYYEKKYLTNRRSHYFPFDSNKTGQNTVPITDVCHPLHNVYMLFLNNYNLITVYSKFNCKSILL